MMASYASAVPVKKKIKKKNNPVVTVCRRNTVAHDEQPAVPAQTSAQISANDEWVPKYQPLTSEYWELEAKLYEACHRGLYDFLPWSCLPRLGRHSVCFPRICL